MIGKRVQVDSECLTCTINHYQPLTITINLYPLPMARVRNAHATRSEDFGASLHLLLFGAAFAATACVAFLSPDMGKSRNLVLNYDELCTAHEERTSGTKDRGAPEAAKEPLGSSEVRSYETFGDVEKQR